MNADADSDRAVRQRRHRISDGGDGAVRTLERVEECVTLVVDLVTLVASEGLPDEPPVLGERVAIHVLSELVQEPRRALDVGEDHRHGP